MMKCGEHRVIIGVLTFFAEYGAITLMALLLHFSSDFTFRMLAIYFIIQLIFGHYQAGTLLVWEEIHLLLKSHLCFFLTALLLVPLIIQTSTMTFSILLLASGMLIYDILISQFLRHLLYSCMADNVLIIGSGADARSLCNVCRTNRFSMMKVAGLVSLKDEKLFPDYLDDSDVNNIKGNVDVYPIRDLDRLIEELHIDQVIIATPTIMKKDLDHLMIILHQKVQKIKYVPLANGLVTFDSKVEDFDGLLVISSARGRNTWPFKILKRIIDIIGAIFGCILLLPLTMYVRHVNRKYGDTGPIFFVQQRIGKNGELFKIYKFRTMVPNADAILEDLMKKDAAIRAEYEENKKLVNDPRITQAGKFLRAKSLDEMPQFFNVFKGEMSLVGPRPYLPKEKNDMGIYYSSVIQSKPGITGMWQSHGRSDINFVERCKLDDYYYSNWNLWLDITIMIKTIKVVLYGKGAI